MHRDDGVEFLLAGVGHHPVAHDAGVVHQHIQATERVDGGLDQGGSLIPVRDVGAVSDGFASGGGDLVDDALGRAASAVRGSVQAYADVVDDHACTFVGEGQGVRAADTAARSRDDDDAAVDYTHARDSST